jgi:dienelactone hydrolase
MTKGSAFKHTAVSQQGLIMQATIGLPSSLTGGPVFYGRWASVPSPLRSAKVPVVVFMHGSSGLSLKAIEDYQRWLAGLGIASVAPDSFALANRLQYQSPVDKDTYEKIHALRASEIEFAMEAVRNTPWVDARRIVLAGTSEGAVSVARYSKPGIAARLLYAWSCEDNYFVQAHRTAVMGQQPVLNVISTKDPFFSAANSWVGMAQPVGNCGGAFASNRAFRLTLVPDAPHTLIQLAPTQEATSAFLKSVLRL